MKYTGDIDQNVPVYTTRKSADGNTMTYNLDGRSAVRIVIYGAIALQLWIFLAILAALGVIGWAAVTAVLWLLALL
jgi:hypothetical protein